MKKLIVLLPLFFLLACSHEKKEKTAMKQISFTEKTNVDLSNVMTCSFLKLETNDFLAVLDVSELKELAEEGYEFNSDLKSILDGIEEESNPVICKIRLK